MRDKVTSRSKQTPERERERERNRMEVEQYEGGGVKRKLAETVEKKIFIFMNADGLKGAGVFEIDIEIATTFENGLHKPIITIKQQPKPEAEAEAEAGKEIIIKPIATFFEKFPPSVGACFIGSDLYMIPDEQVLIHDRCDYDAPPTPDPDRISPIKFNLINKDTFHIPSFPIARKISPLIVAVRNNVYAFSTFDFSVSSLPEPCCESLNLNYNNNNNNNNNNDDNDNLYKWSSISQLGCCCSPLHKEGPYAVTGHAVLKESFILVSLVRINTLQGSFYSYNIQTGKWKTVNTCYTKVGCPSFDSLLNGEGVVINNNIYSYHHHTPVGKLIVFSFSNNVSEMGSDANNDLILCSARVVEGSNFVYDRRLFSQSSSALGKVDDGTLCVLHALYQDESVEEAMHVYVSIIQLEESDRCNTLKSFCCRLEVEILLYYPQIKSCIVLDPKGTGDHRPSKRAAL